MSKGIYLTIDDSPSAGFGRKLKYLHERNIPAVFFCRGDRLQKQLPDVLKAIQMGYVIGNHGYSHRHFSTLSPQACCREIDKTHELISKAYEACGIQAPPRLFRFPYGDKGDNRFGLHFYPFKEACLSGLKHFVRWRYQVANSMPGAMKSRILHRWEEEGRRKKIIIQQHLVGKGYTPPSFSIHYRFFKEFAEDADWLWTLDAEEWRYKYASQIPEEAGAELQDRLVMNDPPLAFGPVKEGHGMPNLLSDEVLLIHDHEETESLFYEIMDYLQGQHVTFLDPLSGR
ncbi:polysaccharide deacetylase family protein [Roseivirga sp. BDSF3-8]|uniref:polysaccharide deacetylase family protein n=1 Tax=Roseivirga sp. BDSF3-8 TaxID=3241598 RepID=UPI00353277BA